MVIDGDFITFEGKEGSLCRQDALAAQKQVATQELDALKEEGKGGGPPSARRGEVPPGHPE